MAAPVPGIDRERVLALLERNERDIEALASRRAIRRDWVVYRLAANRAAIRRMDLFFARKIGGLHAALYRELMAGPPSDRRTLREYQAIPVRERERREEYLRRALARIVRPGARRYAAEILGQWETRAAIERLELVPPERLRLADLLDHAVRLKDREIAFLSDLAARLGTLFPERPDWALVVSDAIPDVERRRTELARFRIVHSALAVRPKVDLAELRRIPEDEKLLGAAIAAKESEAAWLEDQIKYFKAMTLPAEVIADFEAVLKAVRERLAELYAMRITRVSTNLYIIIAKREKDYIWRGKRVRRKYPSGRFQAVYQHNAVLDPETREVLKDREPYPTDIKICKGDFLEELEEKFEVYYWEEHITVGDSNVTPDQRDVGKPPKKILIERVVDKPVLTGWSPKETWTEEVGEFILTEEEYREMMKRAKK